MDYEKSELLETSTSLAKEMIECGGEIFRAEEAIRRIFNNNCTIFALPSLIVAQSDDCIVTKRINKGSEDLTRLCTINTIVRRLAREDAADIAECKGYSELTKHISIFGATFSFCIFFGGNIFDAILSGIIGIIISLAGYKKIKLPTFSSNLIDSFIAGFLALLPSQFTEITNSNKIIIGTIMLLVPGLTVANSIRDMMNRDLIAGLIELAEAILSALSIAFGVGGAMLIFNQL